MIILAIFLASSLPCVKCGKPKKTRYKSNPQTDTNIIHELLTPFLSPPRALSSPFACGSRALPLMEGLFAGYGKRYTETVHLNASDSDLHFQLLAIV